MNKEHIKIAKYVLREVAEEIAITEFKNRHPKVEAFAERMHDYLLKMAESDKGASQYLPKRGIMGVHINESNKGPAGNSKHIVKVQLCVSSSEDNRQVLIYNHSKTLFYEEDASKAVLDLMGDDLKAFFHASLDENGLISLDERAEDQDW